VAQTLFVKAQDIVDSLMAQDIVDKGIERVFAMELVFRFQTAT
jgi:hypothetical protein